MPLRTGCCVIPVYIFLKHLCSSLRPVCMHDKPTPASPASAYRRPLPHSFSLTTPRGGTPPRDTATAGPSATNSLPEGTSASGKKASIGLREASSAADRHFVDDGTGGTRLRPVSGREKSPAESSLCGPARPALRRDDNPRGFSSNEVRRVTFAVTRADSREHVRGLGFTLCIGVFEVLRV